MRSDAPRSASRTRGQPDIAAIHERNLVFINVGETQQTAFLRFLRARQSGRTNDKKENKAEHDERKKPSDRNHQRSSLERIFAGLTSSVENIATSGLYQLPRSNFEP